MALTVEQLFERGAHHTVEQLVIGGEATFADVSRALTRRFGAEIAQSAAAVAELRERVISAVNAGNEFTLGRVVSPGQYGYNPAVPEAYSYTVIATIRDPIEGGKDVSIPWTINTSTPLSQQEILERAERELNQGVPLPDTLVGARAADLIRRRLRFRDVVKDNYGGEAPIDLEILGAYRRD